MSMTASIKMELTVTEDLDTQVDAATSPQIIHNAFNLSEAITDLTTASPVTHVYAEEITLSGTTEVIDLTSFTGSGGGTKDATGLKIQAWKLVNLSVVNFITIEEGASNGYPILGAVGDLMTCLPEGSRQGREVDLLPDVSASVKDILITGTSGHSFQIIIVMG